jgi:NAD(P)-dependent dehydrogenase (short-subunit alcohol dehydrogenase family)
MAERGGGGTGAAGVVVVTGGARGIGRSIVDHFLGHGWTVGVLDVNEKALGKMRGAAATEHRLEVEQVSITDRPAVERVVDRLVERHGGVDALVNNAGMTLPGSFLDQTDEDWARILEVNLTGTFVVSQVAARRMVDAGSGAIVNVSSISAHGVRTGPPSYAAAKAGVEGLSRLMAVQLGALGVRVNTIVVGSTGTPWLLGRKSEDELDEIRATTLTGRLGDPDDVAAMAAFLVSPAARHVTGQLVSVSGGQWMP